VVRDYQLACVIVTYNRAERLRICLGHTLQQDVDLVLVVDNAPTDGTPAVLAEVQATDHRVRVERQRRNRGGAWGFARGLRRADQLLAGRGWVLLFDDDAWPEPDCIATFHDRVSRYRREGVTAVGAAVFNSRGQPVEANRPVLNLFSRPVEVLGLTLPSCCCLRDLYHVPGHLLAHGDRHLAVDSISFVGLFLNLDSLPAGRVRYPRGALFIYSDDTIYTLQLVRNGRRMILDTALVFRHDTQAGGASTPWLLPLWKHYYVVRNSFLMNRALSRLWYVPLCIATVLLYTLKALRMRLRRGDGTLLAMVGLGLIDGVRNRYTRPHAELVRRCEAG
jgi:GT2 family glycosyltransferase